MNAKSLPLLMDQAFRGGFFDAPDPGASGTIGWSNQGHAICRVTTAAAESRTLPAASSKGVGTQLIIIHETYVGDLTIDTADTESVVLTAAGQAAGFIVSASSGTNQWRATFVPLDAAQSISVLSLPDGADTLLIGDASDITMGWDGTNFLIDQATANSAIHIGVDDAGLDVLFFGDTASSVMTWDQSLDSLVFTAAHVHVGDNAQIRLGDAAGGDMRIAWNATLLAITQAAPNSAIQLGVDGAGIDVIFQGDTASQSMTWDQSADDLVFTSAVQITGAGTTVAPIIPAAAAIQELVADGDITITQYLTTGDTTAATITSALPNGAQANQLKKVCLVVDGGNDWVITPVSMSGGTTLTLADVGDFAIWQWNGTAWLVIDKGNMASGDSGPVIA